MNESWREQIQQKLADFEQSAPELDWAAVERRVAAENSKARVVPMWLRRVAAAAAVIAIAIAGYEVLDRRVENNPLAETETLTESHEEPLVAVPAVIEPKTVAAPAAATAQRLICEETTNTATDLQEKSEEHSVKEQASEEESVEQQTVNHQPDVQVASNLAALESVPGVRQHQSTSRLAAKVYLANAIVGSDVAGLTALPGNTTPPEYNNPTYGTNGDPPDYLNPDDGTPRQESVSHRQPIRLGVSLRYSLNDRWSLESGLTCTVLSSDITTVTLSSSVTTEQRLTYVGIPLKLNCQLWNSRHLSVYSSAGGMIEKMVWGHRTTHGLQTHVSQSAPVFSLSGAVGVEYKFTNQFGLYFEPALEYHFEQDTALPTIYNDRPLSFGLGLGFRVTMK